MLDETFFDTERARFNRLLPESFARSYASA